MCPLLCPLLTWAGSHKKAAPPEPPHVRATLPPGVTIPIEPLGFSAPAPFYLGTRNCLVSLDFLDESRLLLTFRVPGLIHRDHRVGVAANAHDPTLVQAAMNDAPISAANNFLDGTALDSKLFAEASINLSAVQRAFTGGSGSCVDFAYMWIHSRSSISITSNQQDYILPSNPVHIANCAGS